MNYARIDEAVARQLFIRHALVHGDFRTRARFANHNRKLLAELDQLESRSRRRDIIADEDELYHFFDQYIPHNVCDGVSFERWWKKVASDQPNLLQLQRQQIMRHAAERITEQQFPDKLEIRGLQLPLHYRFSPGDENDGLCIQLPLAVLNQVQVTDFDWLVPGMLREKIVLLIKSLPRGLRRHFVPAPEFADACLQSRHESGVSLLAWLSGELHRMTGVTVPLDAWRSEALPAHMSPCFELMDAHGVRLAVSRNLAQLQQQFAAQAETDFSDVTVADFERENIQKWDFPDLPEFIEIRRHGMNLRAYPALGVEGDRIVLRLLDQPQRALQSHREGLLALFRRQAGRTVKEIRRCIPDLQKQALWFSSVSDAGVLLDDIERALLQEVFLPEGDDNIRDARTFRAVLERGIPVVAGQAIQFGRWSLSALQAFHDLQRHLGKPVTPPMIAAVQEVKEQMQAMIYPGFVSATPVEWLPHLGRYLRACARRLERLPADPVRDRRLAASIHSFRERYAREVVRRPRDRALRVFRWYIEELSVSLFAQELGTSVKVSPQRLERLWKTLQQA
jgi:ATP-dependent helicase HrpA